MSRVTVAPGASSIQNRVSLPMHLEIGDDIRRQEVDIVLDDDG